MGNNEKRQYLSNSKVKESLLFITIAIVILLYSLINHYTTKDLQWGLSPYLFPLLVSVFMISISISLFVEGIKDEKLRKKEEINKVEKKEKVYWKEVIFVIFISLVYYLAMDIIGFIFSTTLFLVILFVFLGERRKWILVLISLSTTAIIYFIFSVLLHVMLP
ncbi:MAG: tripartite tricarboxylate transporter TctB family protein [Tissierellia bacterium]|nr:tripartite tricarboxylate transporter TctB family protein [Tissierellia bacterium]MDD4726883.1 tripartite tricarboxylate transporter TctB family protein [Tissierellia bacterium]